MAGFSMRAEISYLDPKDLDTVINAFVRAEMIRAIRVFLRTCISRIPVRTGFLRGAFSNIAREFDFKDAGSIPSVLDTLFSSVKDVRSPATFQETSNIQQQARQTRLRFKNSLRNLVNISPGGSIHGGAGRQEYYRDGLKKVLKTPTSGIPYATDPAQVLRVSGGKAEFNLTINIRYYDVNDFTSRIRGAPWRSLDAGAAAMVNYLESAANRFPDLTKAMGRTVIEISGKTVTNKTTPAVISRRTFEQGIGGVFS